MDEELHLIKLDCYDRKAKTKVQKTEPDPNLSATDRALVLLSKGDDVQKLSVLSSLTDIVRTDKNGVFNQLLPKIQSLLPSASSEFQISAAKLYIQFAELNLLTPLMVTNILSEMRSKDPAVSNSWSETLISVIPAIPAKVITSQIEPFVLKEMSIETSLTKKIYLAKILGAIAAHGNIDKKMIKNDIVPACHVYVQDEFPEVRATICLQFPAVAAGCDNESISILLKDVTALGKEDKPIVRVALLSVIVNLVPYFGQDILRSQIVPLVIQLINGSVHSDDDTKIIAAKELGNYCKVLSSFFTPEQTNFLTNCYQILSSYGLSPAEMKQTKDPSLYVACRQHCAANLPLMTEFIVSKNVGKNELLFNTIRTLASDSFFVVRRITANNFSEICKFLGSNINMVKEIFLQLVRDPSDDVIVGLIPYLATNLNLFALQGVLQNKKIDQNIVSFGKSLLKCQSNVLKMHNWRIQSIYLRQLEYLPAVFPSDFIYTQFLNPIFDVITSGFYARPTRQQAGRTILKFLRYNLKPEQRNNIRTRLITDVCQSESNYKRIVFVKICSEVFDQFSMEYFKEHFFVHLVKLADDKVSNIRWAVISLIPNLRGMVKKPQDSAIIQVLEEKIAKLLRNEIDRECKALLLKVTQSNAIEVGDKKYMEKNKLLYDEEVRHSVFK